MSQVSNLEPQPRNLPPRSVIGMVHLAALPGSPRARLSMQGIIDAAAQEASTLVQGGVDALLIENMHDVPYLRGAVGPETVAAFSIVAHQLRRHCGLPEMLPMGLQVLAGANEAALAIAHAAGLDFIRAEGFVFAHIADEGLIQACAGALLRYRNNLGAENVRIFADLKKKHASHAITADVDLEETARTAEFFLADGLIVTGLHTDHAAAPEDLAAVRRGSRLPLLVGSGVGPENIKRYLEVADAVIVGSALKENGHWSSHVCPRALERLMAAR